MSVSKGWIIGSALVVGTIAVYYVAKQKRKIAPKPVIIPPPGTGPGTGNSTGGTTGPAPGPAGTNVYSKAGLTIRSSPEIYNGWFNSGFLGNVIAEIAVPNVFVGNIATSTVDSNGDADSTGNIFTWYRINPAPAYGIPGGQYYVREDYVTIK